MLNGSKRWIGNATFAGVSRFCNNCIHAFESPVYASALARAQHCLLSSMAAQR